MKQPLLRSYAPARLGRPGSNGFSGRSGNVLVVLLLLVGTGFGAWKMGWFDDLLKGKEEVAIEGAPVRRGDLRISEVVRGNLEATDSITLKCEVEGRSTIIYLAEEGKMLKAGDLVVELDVSQLEDELVRQEIVVKNAEAAFTKAKEQYDIQVIQNESDIAQARLALELAELDLAKYVGVEDAADAVGTDTDSGETITASGEWHNELQSAEETVALRTEDLTRAQIDFEWSEKLEAEGFVQKSELDADRLACKRAEIQLDQAKRGLDLLIRYGNRRKLAELRADVATRNRDVDKTRKQASARLTDFEAARESSLYQLERERIQLAEQRAQVVKSKIFAPEDGLMVYARERSRWGSGDSIEEGDEVRERQDIATIPRAGGMTVKASIHETKLKKIQVGQPCIVTVDAFPDRTFDGRVDFVAIMADSGSWRSNPNQRLYKADISLLNPTLDMRPGMSCSVEILVEDLKDVHYVPRQSVFLDGGETIAFVVDGPESKRVSVKVGLDNSKWVTVLEGLTENQIVALAPPADFQPEPVPEAERPDMPAGMPVGANGKRPGAATGQRPGGAQGRPSGAGGGRPAGAGGGRPSGKGGSSAAGKKGSGRPMASRASEGGKAPKSAAPTAGGE